MSPSHGQKGFNGVAILSKHPLEEVAHAACPATTATTKRAIIEAIVSVPTGVVQGRLDLPAERQSRSATREIPLQARLDDAAASEHVARAAGSRRSVRHGGRLQRHPRADRRQAPRRRGPTMRCSSRRRAPPTARSLNLGLTDAVRALPSRARRLHVLGLSGRRLAEGRRHPHRSPAAVAAGGRPARRRRHRQLHPRLGEAVRSRAGLGRARRLSPLLAALGGDNATRRRQEHFAVERALLLERRPRRRRRRASSVALPEPPSTASRCFGNAARGAAIEGDPKRQSQRLVETRARRPACRRALPECGP